MRVRKCIFPTNLKSFLKGTPGSADIGIGRQPPWGYSRSTILFLGRGAKHHVSCGPRASPATVSSILPFYLPVSFLFQEANVVLVQNKTDLRFDFLPFFYGVHQQKITWRGRERSTEAGDCGGWQENQMRIFCTASAGSSPLRPPPPPPLTSLDPNVLAEFGWHADQESRSFWRLHLMEVVAGSPQHLEGKGEGAPY